MPNLGPDFKDSTEGCKKYCGVGACLIGCCCGIPFLILFILFVCSSVIQLGQNKFGLKRNKVSGVVDLGTTYTPGRYYIGFWSEFIEFPSTLKTIEFSAETPESGVQKLDVLRSRDQDGKQIFLSVSIQYQILKDEVGQLYKDMTILYEQVYISALRDALQKVGNAFTVSSIWENYKMVNKLMKDACIATLATRHAKCWDLQLWQVQLESRYESALITTQVRKQAQRTATAQQHAAFVRSVTQVILAEYRKNVTILQSTGQAQAYEITRSANANAEANTIRAQAEVLSKVRDILKVNKTDRTMNETDLVQYQRYLMLQSQSDAHFVFNQNGGSMEAVNVRAARLLSNPGGTRRLSSPPLEL